MNALLEPGMLVRHPQEPDWGLGQVQSNIGGRITVNFEHRGKVVIDGRRVDLTLVYDTGKQHICSMMSQPGGNATLGCQVSGEGGGVASLGARS